MPARQLSRLDLPTPEGPTTATTLPRGTSQSRLRKSQRPSRFTPSPLMETCGSGGAAAGVSVSRVKGGSLRIAKKIQCFANRSDMLVALHRHQFRGKQFVPQFLVFFFVHGFERLA